MTDDSRIKPAAALIAAFFDEDRARRAGQYTSLFSTWATLVGERLAVHSRIVELENGVVIVEAEHPGWIQLLQFRQSAILEGLAARFPELSIRSIVFRLGRSKDFPPKFTPEELEKKSAPSEGSPSGSDGRMPQAESEPSLPGERGPGGADSGLPQANEVQDPGLRDILGRLEACIRHDAAETDSSNPQR